MHGDFHLQRTLLFPEDGGHGVEKTAKSRALRARYPLGLHIVEDIWV